MIIWQLEMPSGWESSFLGLTVGVVTNDMENDERRETYNCVILYITMN